MPKNIASKEELKGKLKIRNVIPFVNKNKRRVVVEMSPLLFILHTKMKFRYQRNLHYYVNWLMLKIPNHEIQHKHFE